MKAIGYLLWFELKGEMTGLRILTPILLLEGSLGFLFYYAFSHSIVFKEERLLFAIAFFWLSILLASSLGLVLLLRQEKEEGILDFYATMGFPFLAVMIAKGIFFWIALLIASIALCILGTLFFSLPLTGAKGLIELLWLPFLSTSLGIASLGVLLASLTSKAKKGDLFFPVLYFPFMFPLFLAGLKGSMAIYLHNSLHLSWPLTLSLFWWIAFLLLGDLTYRPHRSSGQS